MTHDMSVNMQTAARSVEQVRQTMKSIVEAADAVDQSVQKVSSSARALR
nr:hypothetical protein [Methylobacterium sp. L1A1]